MAAHYAWSRPWGGNRNTISVNHDTNEVYNEHHVDIQGSYFAIEWCHILLAISVILIGLLLMMQWWRRDTAHASSIVDIDHGIGNNINICLCRIYFRLQLTYEDEDEGQYIFEQHQNTVDCSVAGKNNSGNHRRETFHFGH